MIQSRVLVIIRYVGRLVRVAGVFAFLALVLSHFSGNSFRVYAANFVETTSYDIGFAGGDMAEDASGNLYIADSTNSLVKKYNSSGTFLLQFGGNGTGNGQFTNVLGIAVDASGDVFVVDIDRVQKFTSSGVYQAQFPVPDYPVGIAIDASDNIYVTQQETGTISKFTNSGTFIGEVGSLGTGVGQFDTPSYITLDDAGRMYISDDGNKRVQVLDSNGDFLFQMGPFGPVESYYLFPVDIDVIESTGEIYIADTYNNVVKIYNNSGVLTSSFDVPGNPFGIVAKTNVVLVTSAGDTVLRRFTLDDQAPALTVTPLPSNTTNTGKPQFSGTATDTMSPLLSVAFRIELGGSPVQDWTSCTAADGAFEEVSEVFSCVLTSTSLPPAANYVLYVRATDIVANTNTGSVILAYSFTVVDDAAPVLLGNSFPSNQTYDTTPTITGTATDTVTQITSIEYENAANPGVWTACTATDGALDELVEAFECAVVSPLSLGAHSFNMRATDGSSHTTTGNEIWTNSFTVLAPSTPTVATGAISSIASTSAVVAGNVSSNGGSAVTEKGVVYSATISTPTVSDSKAGVTAGAGTISASLSGLAASTHYYARAFATNSSGTAYGAVVEFTTTAAAPAVPVSLQNVYFTFAKFRYNKYVSPTALRAGDTAYIKNYNTAKLKLLQVFLYDYAKRGNQGFTKSRVTTSSMFLRTNYLLPTGKRYAYVMKFQDRATGIIATKYFVVYTAKVWQGTSVLGASRVNPDVVAAGYPGDSLSPTPTSTITVTPTITASLPPSFTATPTSSSSSVSLERKPEFNTLLPAIPGVTVVGYLLYRWRRPVG